jgi:hypothetical protein
MLKEHPYIKEIKRKSKNLKKEKNEWKRKYHAILSILHDYPGIAERNLDYRKDMIDLTHDDSVNNDDSRILQSTSDNIINFTNDLHIIKSDTDIHSPKVVVKCEFPDGHSVVCADNDEFKCKKCMTVAPLNCCLLCDRSNICEYCEGSGGDYGKTEAWVCYSCLPTCLTCSDKLRQGCDECCGNGRSDDFEDVDDESSTAAVSEEHQDKNACTICKTEMGSDNARQLCCKTHCGNEEVVEMEVEGEGEESEEEEEEVEESVEIEVVEEEVEEEEVEEEESEEEEEEEEVEEEEVEVEEVEEEEVEVEEGEEEEEEGEEVFGIEVDGKLYYTNDEKNGEVYEALDDDELGDVIGEFKNGKLKLF